MWRKNKNEKKTTIIVSHCNVIDRKRKGTYKMCKYEV